MQTNDYTILINGCCMGDVGVQTNAANDTIELYVNDNNEKKVILTMLKEEFSGLTKMFVQFENQILNDINNGTLFRSYMIDNPDISYVKWLENRAEKLRSYIISEF